MGLYDKFCVWFIDEFFGFKNHFYQPLKSTARTIEGSGTGSLVGSAESVEPSINVSPGLSLGIVRIDRKEMVYTNQQLFNSQRQGDGQLRTYQRNGTNEVRRI